MNPDVLADLEEQRHFLVRSLDDLEREVAAGDLDPIDADHLREDYTHRLAEVQRAVEDGRAPIADVPRRRPGRTLVAVVVVGALALAAGLGVARAAGSRRPGESATGDIRQTTSGRLAEARALVDEGKVVDALKLYDAVLRVDPDNVAAMVGRGIVLLRASMGSPGGDLAAEGQRWIERALKVDPGDAETLFYLGVARRLQDDPEGARQAMERARAADPSPELDAAIQQFLASLGA